MGLCTHSVVNWLAQKLAVVVDGKEKDEGKMGAEVNDSRPLQHTGEREMKKGN